MKTIKLNSVQVKGEVALRLFGIDLHEIITNIYYSILDDEAFVNMLNQKANSKDDLYREYMGKVSTLVMDLIDPNDEEHPLTAYNLMTDDDRFYKAWTDELFDLIYENRNNDLS
jgi:phage terminase large subunit